MSDDDTRAIKERVERTLMAATQAVQQNQVWADRVRENWSRAERLDSEQSARDKGSHEG